MYSTALTAAINGMDVQFISVEADIRNGLPSFQMVGYLSAEVREAGERVRAAIFNSGYQMQPMKTLINLSPADVKKRGPSFDLSIAAALLSAWGVVQKDKLKKTVILGELSLNGEVKKVSGILPIVMEAKENGYQCCIIPEENYMEASVIFGIEIRGVKSLKEMVEELNGIHVSDRKMSVSFRDNVDRKVDYCMDYSEIHGQEAAKRAIEIAVAGGHNLLMLGPPGAGKSMLAERIPTILPDLTEKECLDISKIYSVCGMLDPAFPVVKERPFRRVHHTVTRSALIGGGGYPKPGEISLANGGVLFLDELPEMDRSVMESLREPLENRKVTITRNHGIYEFPANFQLVSAMNPCPCGCFPDLNRCKCTKPERDRYVSKISRPLLERIDICIEVPDVEYKEIVGGNEGRKSSDMKDEIKKVRAIQNKRYESIELERGVEILNGHLRGKIIEQYCILGEKEKKFMEFVFDKMHLSVRTYHNILKVARTIADLEGEEEIGLMHLQEAVGYRVTDLRGGSDGSE